MKRNCWRKSGGTVSYITNSLRRINEPGIAEMINLLILTFYLLGSKDLRNFVRIWIYFFEISLNFKDFDESHTKSAVFSGKFKPTNFWIVGRRGFQRVGAVAACFRAGLHPLSCPKTRWGSGGLPFCLFWALLLFLLDYRRGTSSIAQSSGAVAKLRAGTFGNSRNVRGMKNHIS